MRLYASPANLESYLKRQACVANAMQLSYGGSNGGVNVRVQGKRKGLVPYNVSDGLRQLGY